jgi:hypothetical protein
MSAARWTNENGRSANVAARKYSIGLLNLRQMRSRRSIDGARRPSSILASRKQRVGANAERLRDDDEPLCVERDLVVLDRRQTGNRDRKSGGEIAKRPALLLATLANASTKPQRAVVGGRNTENGHTLLLENTVHYRHVDPRESTESVYFLNHDIIMSYFRSTSFLSRISRYRLLPC